MNWSKAKTILIIALLITDLFLVFTYGEFGAESEEFRDYKALSEFLAQKNIFVDAAIIPKEHKDMAVQFVQKEGGELKAIGFHDKKQKTISAASGLLLFMTQNETEKEIHIESIDMVYWLDESNLDTETAVSIDTAFPAWKIVYNGGEVTYIDAYEHNN